MGVSLFPLIMVKVCSEDTLVVSSSLLLSDRFEVFLTTLRSREPLDLSLPAELWEFVFRSGVVRSGAGLGHPVFSVAGGCDGALGIVG